MVPREASAVNDDPDPHVRRKEHLSQMERRVKEAGEKMKAVERTGRRLKTQIDVRAMKYVKTTRLASIK